MITITHSSQLQDIKRSCLEDISDIDRFSETPSQSTQSSSTSITAPATVHINKQVTFAPLSNSQQSYDGNDEYGGVASPAKSEVCQHFFVFESLMINGMEVSNVASTKSLTAVTFRNSLLP